MKSWNSETNQWWYEKTMEEAKEIHGFSDDELRIQNLSNPYFHLIIPHGNQRMLKLIKLAFFLGRLRQIRWMDEGLDIVSPQEVKR